MEDDTVEYQERQLLQRIRDLRARLCSDEVAPDAAECLADLLEHFIGQGYEEGSCHDAAEAMVHLLESVFKVAEMVEFRQSVGHAHTVSYTPLGHCPCNADSFTMEQTNAATVYHLHLHLHDRPLALVMDQLLEQFSGTEAVEAIGYHCEDCGWNLDPCQRSSRLTLIGDVLICHAVVPDYMASADFRISALYSVFVWQLFGLLVSTPSPGAIQRGRRSL